jgi:8-oxo-dGTP pyrophosphatase MutT (NUDIX family)
MSRHAILGHSADGAPLHYQGCQKSCMTTTSYLADLRDLVGNRLLIIPAAVAFIFDDENRLLVARLAGHAKERWGLTGGSIEVDETPEQAVIRETFEETSLYVQVDALHNVYAGPDMRVTYPNGDEGAYVMVAYRCTITGGEMRANVDKLTELRFVSESEATALQTAPWGRIVIPDAFNRGRA